MSFKNFIAKSVKLRPQFEEELLVVYLPWKEQFDILIEGEIPEFIMDIYSQCNGTDPAEKITENYYFIPEYRLMKIQEVLKLHGELVKKYSITKDVIPFLVDKDDNYVCYRLKDNKADVIHFSNGDMKTMYDSTELFWETISKGYDDKIFGIDFKKCLSADPNKFETMAKSLNPNSNYWQS